MVVDTRARKKAEKAFARAIAALPGNVTVRDLPKSFRVLQPHFEKPRYRIAKLRFAFSIRGGDVASSRVPGVVLASILPVGKSTGVNSDLPFFTASLARGNKELFFSPLLRTGSSLKRNWFGYRTTSFGHALLVFNGEKPVVFVPVLQKIMGLDEKAYRRVDTFVGTEGAGRHLIHLALAEQIVREMKKRGVEAELHVPAAEHHGTTGKEEVDSRIRKPFAMLERHFHEDSLEFGNARIRTINLSKPRGLVFTE